MAYLFHGEHVPRVLQLFETFLLGAISHNIAFSFVNTIEYSNKYPPASKVSWFSLIDSIKTICVVFIYIYIYDKIVCSD